MSKDKLTHHKTSSNSDDPQLDTDSQCEENLGERYQSFDEVATSQEPTVDEEHSPVVQEAQQRAWTPDSWTTDDTPSPHQEPATHFPPAAVQGPEEATPQTGGHVTNHTDLENEEFDNVVPGALLPPAAGSF